MCIEGHRKIAIPGCQASHNACSVHGMAYKSVGAEAADRVANEPDLPFIRQQGLYGYLLACFGRQIVARLAATKLSATLASGPSRPPRNLHDAVYALRSNQELIDRVNLCTIKTSRVCRVVQAGLSGVKVQALSPLQVHNCWWSDLVKVSVATEHSHAVAVVKFGVT